MVTEHRLALLDRDRDGPVEASKHDRRAEAAALLRSAGLPPTERWVDLFRLYLEGRQPELTHTLDPLLASGAELTPAQCDALHARFCLSDPTVGVEGSQPQTAPDPLAAGGEASRQPAPAPLLSRVHEVIERIKEVEQSLKEAQREINELRNRLARAEQQASTDSLTGIANRRGVMQVLQDAIRVAHEQRQCLSLLMIDVDHFKAFNDRFGHHTGDHVLRLVAHALIQLPGGRRMAARYGGEEFAVVLPDVGLHDAMAMAEELRVMLASRRLFRRGTGEALDHITVSIGLAELAGEENAKQLLRRADFALYRAKRAGRNRVMTDSQSLAPAD